MNLQQRFRGCVVPQWCSDLDDINLKVAWEKDASMYLLDLKSPFSLKKGFLSNSMHAFRFKFIGASGSIYYFFAIEDKVHKINESTLSAELVDGLQILKTVSVKDETIKEIQWKDDVLPFQGKSDPMYSLYLLAKSNALKTAPNYLNFIE